MIYASLGKFVKEEMKWIPNLGMKTKMESRRR
jgi:hypothetical protein